MDTIVCLGIFTYYGKSICSRVALANRQNKTTSKLENRQKKN